MILLLLLVAAALAAPPLAGERLRWQVRYAGVAAGEAWAEARADPLGLVVKAGAQNAPWYAPIYTMQDLVWSTFAPGRGSLRYQTRFREGGFHQDQDMRLYPDRVEVWRNQRIDGAWKAWTDTYPPCPGAEDPVSAMYALRQLEGEGPWSAVVWTGKKAITLNIVPMGATALETVFGVVEVRKLMLIAPHKGQVEQRGGFVVYLTGDERHVPVRAELKSNVGVFRADLIGYRAPDGTSWGAPEAEYP